MAADPAQAMAADAPVQVLLMDHQTRVEKSGTWRYQHAIRKINETAGLQNGAQIQFEFDPDYQKLVMHRLEIWRDGKRIDKLADRKIVKILHRETQLERQMVDGRMTASIVLDDLRVGDRVEWSASLVGDNPVFEGKFVDQEWTAASLGPIGLVQMRLLAPAERQIRHREDSRLGIEVTENVKDGWRETIFRRHAVPQFHYDPLTPPAEFLADQLQFSEFANWSEVAAWADQLFSKSRSGLDALTPEVDAIKAKAETPADRLRLALDFVQQDIRYFGTEMGANSHQPATADTVLRQRFGDCKDKAALLVNLLARLDIEASPVLVSVATRDAVSTRLPSPLAFDHAIVTTKLDGQTLWLDGTRNEQRGAPVTRVSYGLGQGLVARADTTALSAMPRSRDALRSETTDTFRFPKLAEDGSLDSVTIYYNDLAEGLRAARAAMPADDMQKALVGEILRGYPRFTIDGPAQFEEVEGSNAIKVSLHFKASTEYWRFPGKRSLAGDFGLINLLAPLRLPSQTPRTQGMLIGMPGRYLHKLRFEFGEEVGRQTANSNRFDENNENFALNLRSQTDLHSIQVEGELRLLADEIPAAQWTHYRDQVAKVFPRLVTFVAVPVIAPSQLPTLENSLKELSESVKRGSIKVVTSDQRNIRVRLMAVDAELAAGRLPPKQRASVLVERGQLLDQLGQAEAGKIAMDQALKLDPDSAEAYGSLGFNAFMRRQDAEAVSHADRALQLAPNDVQNRYTRAWAHYFAGDLPQARDELKDILQTNNAEVERSYGSIWLYLVSRRMGENGDAAAGEITPPTDSKPAWPFAVLQLMQGKLDMDGALAAARDTSGGADVASENLTRQRDRECELYFYAAQKALADQDTAKARSYLRKSLDTGVVEFNEYTMAQRELERIGAK